MSVCWLNAEAINNVLIDLLRESPVLRSIAVTVIFSAPSIDRLVSSMFIVTIEGGRHLSIIVIAYVL